MLLLSLLVDIVCLNSSWWQHECLGIEICTSLALLPSLSTQEASVRVNTGFLVWI